MVAKKQAFLIAPLVISVIYIIFGLIGMVIGLPARLGLPPLKSA